MRRFEISLALMIGFLLIGPRAAQSQSDSDARRQTEVALKADGVLSGYHRPVGTEDAGLHLVLARQPAPSTQASLKLYVESKRRIIDIVACGNLATQLKDLGPANDNGFAGRGDTELGWGPLTQLIDVLAKQPSLPGADVIAVHAQSLSDPEPMVVFWSNRSHEGGGLLKGKRFAVRVHDDKADVPALMEWWSSYGQPIEAVATGARADTIVGDASAVIRFKPAWAKWGGSKYLSSTTIDRRLIDSRLREAVARRLISDTPGTADLAQAFAEPPNNQRGAIGWQQDPLIWALD